MDFYSVILKYTENQQKIFEFYNDLFLSYDNIKYKTRYKIPFYYGETWICYLSPKGEVGVELCFLRPIDMKLSVDNLDYKDRKQIAGITIVDLDQKQIRVIKEIFEEAIFVDETIKYTPKNNRKL